MRDRLFTIIDGEPVITPPLVNIPAFKKLWAQDKSDDKNVYKKWMYYIYCMCDYRSDYFELRDKKVVLCRELFDNGQYKIPTKVIACMEEYKDRNCPAEQRSLESAISNARNIDNSLAKIYQDSKQMEDVLRMLDDQIDKQTDPLVKVELLKEKLTLQERHMNLLKVGSELGPKIQKSVEAIVALREIVEKAMLKIEDNPDKVENYIVDEFIALRDSGDFNIENEL